MTRTAMILAAGLGKRMLPLTAHTPKALLTVAGKPLVVWHIERLARQGFRRIVINRNDKGAQLESTLGTGAAFGVEILWSRESQQLETGGGLLKALPLVGDAPFLVVNADVFTDLDFSRLTLDHNSQACLVLVPNPEHNPQGDFCLQDGRIQAEGDPKLTFAGISLLDPVLLRGHQPGAFPIAPVLRQAAACGKVTGCVHSGYWIDAGTPGRLEQVEQDLAQGRCALSDSRHNKSLTSDQPA